MMHIYRGIIPFVLLQLMGLLVLALFPAIVTWLPAIFFGN
jgi:TRAP-type mannitol/chloroaromatic compound transport system permease large subunit